MFGMIVHDFSEELHTILQERDTQVNQTQSKIGEHNNEYELLQQVSIS